MKHEDFIKEGFRRNEEIPGGFVKEFEDHRILIINYGKTEKGYLCKIRLKVFEEYDYEDFFHGFVNNFEEFMYIYNKLNLWER